MPSQLLILSVLPAFVDFLCRAGNVEQVQLCVVRTAVWKLGLGHWDAPNSLLVATAHLHNSIAITRMLFHYRLRARGVHLRRSDFNDPDEKIVVTSEGFAKCTGYEPSDVLGRNCRFLQGKATEPMQLTLVRKALRAVRITCQNCHFRAVCLHTR